MHFDFQVLNYKDVFNSVRIDWTNSHRPCNGINYYTDGSLTGKDSDVGIRRMETLREGIPTFQSRHTLIYQAQVLEINIRVHYTYFHG